MSATLFETERLVLRRMNDADAPFYLSMLSDPDFKANIADRGVRTEEQALAHTHPGRCACHDHVARLQSQDTGQVFNRVSTAG